MRDAVGVGWLRFVEQVERGCDVCVCRRGVGDWGKCVTELFDVCALDETECVRAHTHTNAHTQRPGRKGDATRQPQTTRLPDLSPLPSPLLLLRPATSRGRRHLYLACRVHLLAPCPPHPRLCLQSPPSHIRDICLED